MKKVLAILLCAIAFQAQAFKIKKTYFAKSEIDAASIPLVNFIDSFDDAGKRIYNKEFDANGNLLFLNIYNYEDDKIISINKTEYLFNSDNTSAGQQEVTAWYFYKNNVLEKIAVTKSTGADSVFKYFDALEQPLNGRLNYQFDKQGRMIQSVSKAGKTKQKNTTKYSYNKQGKLAKVQELEGKKLLATTTYLYNILGQVTSEIYVYKRGKEAHTAKTVYTYAGDKLVAEVYQADDEPKETITYEYD